MEARAYAHTHMILYDQHMIRAKGLGNTYGTDMTIGSSGHLCSIEHYTDDLNDSVTDR